MPRAIEVTREEDGCVKIAVTDTSYLALSEADIAALRTMSTRDDNSGHSKEFPGVDLFRLYSLGFMWPMGHGRYQLNDIGLAVAARECLELAT